MWSLHYLFLSFPVELMPLNWKLSSFWSSNKPAWSGVCRDRLLTVIAIQAALPALCHSLLSVDGKQQLLSVLSCESVSQILDVFVKETWEALLNHHCALNPLFCQKVSHQTLWAAGQVGTVCNDVMSYQTDEWFLVLSVIIWVNSTGVSLYISAATKRIRLEWSHVHRVSGVI